LIPPEISSRPKRPYRAPIQRCFFNSQCETYARGLLSSPALDRVGLFHAGAVGQLVRKVDAGTPLSETDAMALVGVLSTQLLHQRFIDGFEAPRPLDSKDDVKVVRRQTHTG
jgi:asparagine synthase (glutamine-hydrolysing)